MKKHRALLTSVLGLALAAGAIGYAEQGPASARHGDLDAAQQLIKEAIQKIEAAQQYNHAQLGGHAKKAEELLNQASSELGMAKDYANQHDDKHR